RAAGSRRAGSGDRAARISRALESVSRRAPAPEAFPSMPRLRTGRYSRGRGRGAFSFVQNDADRVRRVLALDFVRRLVRKDSRRPGGILETSRIALSHRLEGR